jgi:hypothetical protein
MRPVVDRMRNIDVEIERAVADAVMERDREILSLRHRVHGLTEEAAGMKRLRRLYEATKDEVTRAVTMYDNVQLELMAQHEQTKTLVKTIERQENTLRARDGLVDETEQNKYTMEQRLWQAVDKHAALLTKYNRVVEQLRQRTEQLDGTRQNEESMTKRYERSERERRQLLEDYHRTRNQYRIVRKRLRSGMLTDDDGSRMDPDTGRVLTPRPDWDRLQTDLPQAILPFDTKALTKEGTSSEFAASQMVEWVGRMAKDVREAEAALPWQTDNEERLAEMKRQAAATAAGGEGFTGKWFVCQGTGPNIPKFLRFNGRVRNKMMSKRETEQWIEELWDAKIRNDNRPNAKKKSVQDFVYDHCKSRYGVQNMIAEFGYNLVDALSRYAYDADCEMFHKILMGELCEDVYHEQMKMMDDFSAACLKRDKEEHGGKPLGVL